MKNNFFKKINTSLLIFILLIFLFVTNSFAVTQVNQTDLNILSFEDTYLQALESLPEYVSGDYWYTLRKHYNNVSVLFISKENYPDLKQIISNESYSNGSSVRMYFNTPRSELYGVFYNYSNGSFVKNSAEGHGYYDIDIVNGDSVYIGGNIDIYTDDTYNTVFFRVVPLTELAEILAETQPQEKTLAEIVGILPILLIVIVGLLAFWKAWHILLRLLRNS